MRRAALLCAVAGLLTVTAFGGEGNVRRSTRRIPGRYIVVLAAGADSAAVASTVRNVPGARVRNSFERGLKGFSLEMSDADAQSLARDSRVQYVEEDATVSAATTWGLDRIDQRSLPLNGENTTEGTGAGVRVYIVDTGILATHNDFAGRVAAGFSAFAEGGTGDCNGHGTHVAGLVGGATYGVAKAATLVPVRVLDCSGAGSTATVLAGLEWILDEQSRTPGAAVVNMSLGGDASSAVDAAVGSLIRAGISTVVAAGNSNENACGTSPARVPAALTVGATTETDQRASFSNYGPCVDLFAPGVNILSASYGSATATAVSTGTSAAAPLVSGVAALCLEKFPDASPAIVAQTLRSQATADLLGGIGTGSPNRLLFSSLPSMDLDDVADAQLLSDPGFEGESFWTSDVCSAANPAGCTGGGADMQESFSAHKGKKHVALGGAQRSFNVTSETLTIPASVRRAQLSVYLWVVTKNNKKIAEDVLTIEIRSAAGALLETVGTYSNLDEGPGYAQRTFDVTRYRGTPIRISFVGVQRTGAPTWFLLDDAAVDIWR